jgi:hypothetical protein
MGKAGPAQEMLATQPKLLLVEFDKKENVSEFPEESTIPGLFVTENCPMSG